MITPITPLSLPPGGPSLLRPSEHHLLPSTSLPPLTWPETGVQAICWEVIPENTGEGVGLRGTHRQLVEHASGGGQLSNQGTFSHWLRAAGRRGVPLQPSHLPWIQQPGQSPQALAASILSVEASATGVWAPAV